MDIRAIDGKEKIKEQSNYAYRQKNSGKHGRLDAGEV